jgi:hypothetical protein
MPRYEITSPDGKRYEITAPEGATQDQVLAYAQQSAGKPASATPAPPVAPNPTEGNNFGENALIGMGKAFTDLGRGARQLASKVGIGDESAVQSEIDESRKLDAPLMKTAGGVVGNVVGTAVPAAVLPGAGTYLGATAAGAAMGAMQPTATGESRALNTAIGGAAGAGGKYIGGKVADALTSRVSTQAAELKALESTNAVKDATRMVGQAAGYVIPPSQGNPGSAWNQLLESFSGKIKTGQAASVKNQEVTNRLAKEALGLPTDAPLTKDALAAVRTQAGQAYAAVEKIPAIGSDTSFQNGVSGLARNKLGGATSNPADAEITTLIQELNGASKWTGSGLIADIKNLREMASANFNAAARSGGDVGKSSMAKAQSKAAELLEDLAERNLLQNNAPQNLIKDYQAARQLIAKTYTVEGALNESTGNVIAHKLAQRVAKGKPTTGELETVGKFAGAFPDSTREATAKGSSTLIGSPLDWGAAGTLSAVSGNPAAMALVGARPAARSLLLSGPYQRTMTSPDYSVGAGTEAARRIANNPRLQRLMPSFFAGGALESEQ